MKENKNVVCEPCEQNFEENIHRIVREGKAPTHEQREKKKSEVKEAFKAEHPAAGTPARKPEMKQPMAAGMAKTKK